MRGLHWALAAACIAATAAPAASAEQVAGMFKRPNGDTVQVSVNGGKLYCTIVAGSQQGFEMCHGMSKTGPGVWQGSDMKHPSMPGFMTFNGTVTFTSGGLSIKGCAIGQSMCDAEDWTRVK